MKTVYLVYSKSGWYEGPDIDLIERIFISESKARQYCEELKKKYAEPFPYDFVTVYIEESELDDSM